MYSNIHTASRSGEWDCSLHVVKHHGAIAAKVYMIKTSIFLNIIIKTLLKYKDVDLQQLHVDGSRRRKSTANSLSVYFCRFDYIFGKCFL